MVRHSLSETVPTHLAFSVMLVLSFLTAWFALYASDQIVKSAKSSEVFDIEKRNGAPEYFE
jgi:hypothetical protein